jgi:hypothetical protein
MTTLIPRLGQWISGTAGLNLTIVPYEQRPDAARWLGEPTYRVKDVFSTRNGSWELSSEFGSIDAWARTDYQQGRSFDGAGGDHNFFILCLDRTGQPLPGKGLLFWQGAMTADFTPSDPRTAKQDGSENLPIFGSYAPERGEHGSWSGAALGRSDVLVGVGMPLNQHVSVFLVLQAVEEVTPPEPEKPVTTSREAFRQALIVAQASGTRSPATLVKRADDILTAAGY